MLQNKSSNSSESGNVFLFILLGVVLFGALAFMISRGMRSETTTAMTDRQSELAAIDILTYAQHIERVIARMQGKGVSENDISFSNAAELGYAHTVPQPPEHDIFDKLGGGISWKKPPAKANDGSTWLITGATCIPEVGTGNSGCNAGTTKDEELLLVLPNMNVSVCRAINEKLGITDIPVNIGDIYSTTKFIGAFAESKEIVLDKKYSTVCFKYSDDTLHFYHVLIAR